MYVVFNEKNVRPSNDLYDKESGEYASDDRVIVGQTECKCNNVTVYDDASPIGYVVPDLML